EYAGEPQEAGGRVLRGGLAAGSARDAGRVAVQAADPLDGQVQVLGRGAAPRVHDRVGAFLQVEVGRADRDGRRTGEDHVGLDRAGRQGGPGLVWVGQGLEHAP